MPVKIFFCYAHEDEELLKALKIHLETFRRQGLIEMWYDRNISAGLEWAHEIDKHLDTAEIILLLVSQYFMASDYCWGIEMMKAIRRHQRGEARVIPIILRPVHFQKAPFGKLQPLPTDQKPVTSKSNQDEAFFDVAEGISIVVEEIMSKPFSHLPPHPAKPVSLKKEGASDFILDIDQATAERNAQRNLFVQPPNIQNQQWISSARDVSASESVLQDKESLFNEALSAQYTGNTEKALELYQQIRKLDPNFKKGERTSHLKKLLERLVSEAKQSGDQKSQMKCLNELIKLNPNDTNVQRRLEKLRSTYIPQLRQRAISARQSSKWEIEYKSWEELSEWIPDDIEIKKNCDNAKIKYLRQQAKNARKMGSWDDEARKWSEILDIQAANTEAKRRQAIAMKNQEHIREYEYALHLESQGLLDEAREALEGLWHVSPYYGDPKKLARKVGILVPLRLEKWRKAIWLTLLAILLILLVISIILSVLHLDSTIAWVGLIADVIVLYILSKYWLLIDW